MLEINNYSIKIFLNIKNIFTTNQVVCYITYDNIKKEKILKHRVKT